MGKKKNKNKVSGAEKTAAKTEKKLANKLKKELANLGEEDIAKVIAEIEREEAKRSAASEKSLPSPPSARAYASLTPHPINNELILFGGEYHDGQQTLVYNELLLYNPEKGSWRQVKAPGAPPPRSAHQAVATQANKGELWIFGGEFTSPSETQFHHYKDLWCFSLAEKKWEKVVSPNGPPPRSGHRMALLGRKLFIFGGYSDDGRECKYFDDLYTFCLDTRTWTKLSPSGRGPSARSACVMMPAGNDSLIIYGGFSRVREGRTERTYTHTDMFRLCVKGEGWQWRSQNGGPLCPPARAGQASAVNVHSGRGYVFGGVADVEETEEDLRGEMSDDLQLVDLETGKFHNVTLRTEQQSAAQKEPSEQPVAEDKKEEVTELIDLEIGKFHNVTLRTEHQSAAQNTQAQEPVVEDKKEEVTVVTDEVFTMKLGGSAPSTVAPAPPPPPGPRAGPCARMSAMLAVQRATLYVYGGVLERDDKQFYLSDMYSLDLHKLNEWRTIIEQPSLPAWLGSDSEGECTDEGSDDDSEWSTDD